MKMCLILEEMKSISKDYYQGEIDKVTFYVCKLSWSTSRICVERRNKND